MERLRIQAAKEAKYDQAFGFDGDLNEFAEGSVAHVKSNKPLIRNEKKEAPKYKVSSGLGVERQQAVKQPPPSRFAQPLPKREERKQHEE